ncbi:tectonic-2-like isoform X1 [Tachypleus tridentatus]|uniref:tectonic-2-like isoform X1 n=1 Tax=Tachypleus tridentatus TaxID=6853 RepID=UPI003FD5D453
MMVCVEREKLRKLLNLYCTILMLGLCAIPCVGKVQGQDIKVNATLHIFPEISVRKHFGKGGFQFVIHSTLTTEDIKCSVIEALGNKEAFFIFENKSCLKDLAPIVPEESVHSGWMKTFNNSVDWNVIVRDLEDYSKTFLIHVEPLNITIHHLMDRLVLMCCLTVDGKREALPMSSLLIVLKSPSVSFNLSRIQGFRKLERYSNPALGEIASCPCDLNEGTCDVYCCCDTDCSTDNKQSFACLSGLQGGYKTESLLDYRCHSSVFPIHDLHYFLCIFRDNSPFLGYYFLNQRVTAGFQDIQKLLLEKKLKIENWDYNLPPVHFLPIQSQAKVVGYLYGQNIQTEISGDQFVRSGLFAIPQNLYSDECHWNGPAQYLVDQESFCNIRVRELCTSRGTSSSILSVKLFDNKDIKILRHPGSNIKVHPEVNVMCTNNTSYYVKDKSTKSFRLPDLHNEEYLIKNAIKPCWNSSVFALPSYSDHICKNIVLDVRYHLFWEAGELVHQRITILLGQVLVESDEVEIPSFHLTQHFELKFYNSKLLNTTNGLKKTKRSGIFGYEFGLPLLSLHIYQNESAATNETNYLGAEMTVDHQFVVWKPGPNNLCEEASKEEVGFGVDIMSGCVLTVADEQLRNCEHLRKKVIDYQSQLFKAEYLSRGGNPDVTNLNDFVKVIRDISSESNSKESRLTLITNHSLWCSQIIQHVQLDVIYSETLGTKGIKVYRIVGARIRYEKGTWKPLLFSTGIHRFIITSGVTFVKMSDQSHKDIKRFWVRKSPYFCNREMCWEEMLFPLTESFSGDPETYVLGWTLCFLLFFIPFVWFTWKNGL